MSANGRKRISGIPNLIGIANYTRHEQPKRASHLARLNHINPGAMIDKLKDETRLKTRDNLHLRQRFNRVSDYVDKRKKRIAEINEKLEQGRSDWKELYRDASVYEFNFARADGYWLRSEIERMVEEIESKRSEFSQYLKEEHVKGGFAWLTDTQHDGLSQVFRELKSIK